MLNLYLIRLVQVITIHGNTLMKFTSVVITKKHAFQLLH